GLEAEQTIVPADHLLLDEADVLPAIVVVRDPVGEAHFVLAWRRHGRLVQVMDPAFGRRWMTREQLVASLFPVRFAVPAADWRDAAASPSFLDPLRRRMEALGLPAAACRERIARAARSSSWYPLAALDACVRTASALVEGRALRRGAEAVAALDRFVAGCRGPASPGQPPEPSWSVWPADGGEVREVREAEEELELRGALVVTLRRTATSAAAEALPSPGAAPAPEPSRRAADLAGARDQRPPRPLREALGFLRRDGLLAPAALTAVAAAAAAGAVIEALLFQGVLELSGLFDSGAARAGLLAVLLVFTAAITALELPLAHGFLRLGRRLEGRFRIAILAKLPRLDLHYFNSRPLSDLASRAHRVHVLRGLPDIGRELIGSTVELIATAAIIVWLDPGLLLPACAAVIALLAMP